MRKRRKASFINYFTMLDAIISDCGIALYPVQYWVKFRAWDALLEEADARNYPYYQLLTRIREAARRSDTVKIELFRDMAREQHWKVYEWFCGIVNVRNHLGCIPAEVHRLIDGYLRCRIVVDRLPITAIMGTLHSFGDEPAQTIMISDGKELRWYKAGVLHRVGGPAVVNLFRGKLECRWYTAGKLGRTSGRAAGLSIGANLCQSVYPCEDGYMYLTERDTAILAEAAALRHEYMPKK